MEDTAQNQKPQQDVHQTVGGFDYCQMVRDVAFTDTPFRDRARELAEQATDIERMVAELVRAANDDWRLSPEGKRDQRLKSAQAFDRQISEMAGRLEPMQKKRQNILADMDEGWPDGSDPAVQIRQREVRDRLHSLSKAEVLKIYRQAGDSGDMETVSAIERAPKSFALVDSETLERERQRRLERKFPEQAERLKNVTALHDTLEAVVAHLKRRLGLS